MPTATPATIAIAVRDSKNPAGPVLAPAPGAFATFLDRTATAAV